MVSSLADALIVRHLAGEWAEELGFPAPRQEDARLIASELAHNHVMHRTAGGCIRLSAISLSGVHALHIASLDRGPGIKDPERAVAGYKTSGQGLGAGLGTVKRLADKMDICSSASQDFPCPKDEGATTFATIISAQLWSRPEVFRSIEKTGLDLWAVSKPFSQHLPCGDGFSLQYDERYIRLIVTDGAGHGPEARVVSDNAVKEIEKWDMLWPADNIIGAMAHAMSGTRGLALSILVLDRYTGALRIAGVGNIRILLKLFSNDQPGENPGWFEVPQSQGGILGQGRWPQINRFEYGPLSQFMAVIHTDGHAPVRQLDLNDLGPSVWAPALLGNTLFRPACQARDDATLIVLRWTRK